MRNIAALLFFILVTSLSIGQNLNGRWHGTSLQKVGDTLFEFRLEVDIVQKGNRLTGTMLKQQNKTKNYSIHKLKGSIRNGLVKLKPTTINKIVYKQSNFDFLCFRNHRGQIKVDSINNRMIFEGENYGIDILYAHADQTYSEGNCPPSTFKLYKNLADRKEVVSSNEADGNDIVILNDKEIKVSLPLLKVKVWDRSQEDGDIINLYLNGKLLFSNMKVTKKGETFDLQLKSGENIIEVEALNEGNVSPNTSAIRIFIKDKEYEIILSAKKGERDFLKLIYD